MATKEDLRVIRTKKALSEAFMSLLEKKTIDQITINELCDAAGIRRATFYKHYSDKFDFISAYICYLRDRFDQYFYRPVDTVLTADYYVSYAKHLVYFINEHAIAVENILKSNIFPLVMAIIVDQNYKDTCKRLEISVKGGVRLPASIPVTASMCAGGVAATIYNWLRDGRKTSPDELSEQVGRVVASAISVR